MCLCLGVGGCEEGAGEQPGLIDGTGGSASTSDAVAVVGEAGASDGDGGAADAARPRPGERDQGAGPPTGCDNESVYERLRPTCVGCHGFGTFPAFASLGSFERLIAYDPSWVIPGDPEHSALLDLLRGRASGSIRAMPPGRYAFADLEARGETLISIDELAECIRQMGPPTRPQASEAVVARLKTAEQVRQALYDQLGLAYSDFVDVDYMHLDRLFVSDPDEV